MRTIRSSDLTEGTRAPEPGWIFDVGKGSVFTVHLPLKEGEAQAVRAKDNPRHVIGGDDGG